MQTPARPHTSATDVPAASPVASGPRRHRVLVVEDDPVTRLLATLLLEKLGVEVAVAADGRKGVEATGGGRFDLILMDCQMPEMDGWEATRTLRRRLDVPIIGLTATTDPSEIEQCRDAGMNECLAKPVTRELCSRVLERWVGRPAGGEPSER